MDWSGWLDKKGNPISPEEWGRLHSDESYMRIGGTVVAGGAYVSTVWVGINMNYTRQGPPIIFETLVSGGPMDGRMWRYATEGQAVIGHDEVVRLAATAGDGDEWVLGNDAASWSPDE